MFENEVCLIQAEAVAGDIVGAQKVHAAYGAIEVVAVVAVEIEINGGAGEEIELTPVVGSGRLVLLERGCRSWSRSLRLRSRSELANHFLQFLHLRLKLSNTLLQRRRGLCIRGREIFLRSGADDGTAKNQAASESLHSA